jgi:DNA polymerase III alpha subunit
MERDANLYAPMFTGMIVDETVDIETARLYLTDIPWILHHEVTDLTIEEWDKNKQGAWAMPQEYQSLDIAAHVLSLCETEQQLQRVGKELLMYQERNMFDLLRYLKFLVDTLKSKNIIWGVGRGSSVASYVLYLLEVHRIDSIYYDLDPGEFLR